MRTSYQLNKAIQLVIVYNLYEHMSLNWIAFLCGAIGPLVDFLIARDKYWQQFPWELYLFFGYGFWRLFTEAEHQLILFGFGYAFTRLALYFQLKTSIKAE